MFLEKTQMFLLLFVFLQFAFAVRIVRPTRSNATIARLLSEIQILHSRDWRT